MGTQIENRESLPSTKVEVMLHARRAKGMRKPQHLDDPDEEVRAVFLFLSFKNNMGHF